MESILVRIKDGKATVTAKGFKGASCLTATRGVEVALGLKTGSVPTAEMQQTAVVTGTADAEVQS